MLTENFLGILISDCWGSFWGAVLDPRSDDRTEKNRDTGDAKASDPMHSPWNCSRHLHTKTFAGQAGRLLVS